MRRTIIGKDSLIITLRGEKEVASQIFPFNQIREIRMDWEKLDIKIQMNNDDEGTFHKVFTVEKNEKSKDPSKEARISLLKFYSDLLNSVMKITPEEVKKMIELRKNQLDLKNNTKKPTPSKPKEKSTEK